MRIIIDGYNLLNAYYTGFPPFDEGARDVLIEHLRIYKKIKRADITVVFDGIKGGTLTGNSFLSFGIKVVFTSKGSSADARIKEMLRNTQGAVVVSSDREIADAAERGNSVSVSSELFSKRLQSAMIGEMRGTDGREDTYRQKDKKGPSKRKKKRDRRKDRIIPDL